MLNETKLIDVCPAYAEALDRFEAEPSEKNWAVVINAARAFRHLKPVPAE